MRVSLLTLLKLALLSHGVPSVSAATPWLEPDLRVSAISLTDVDTFRCLMENADLDKVRSLHIRVGARPGRPSYIAPIDEAFARGMRSISVKEYYETKLPQLAAAASELIERMPRLASFRFASPTSCALLPRTHWTGRGRTAAWLTHTLQMGWRGRTARGGEHTAEHLPRAAECLMDDTKVRRQPGA